MTKPTIEEEWPRLGEDAAADEDAGRAAGTLCGWLLDDGLERVRPLAADGEGDALDAYESIEEPTAELLPDGTRIWRRYTHGCTLVTESTA